MKKIIVTSLALSSLLLAEDATLKLDVNEANPLKASVNLGYIGTQGNTETTTYSIDSKFDKAYNKNLFELRFNAQYASETTDGITSDTKNNYTAEIEYDYSITPKFAFGYLVGFKQDLFSSYAYQGYTGPGAKYIAVKNDQHNLTLKANVLYARDKYDVAIDSSGEVIDEYTSVRLNGVYTWNIQKNLTFSQELTYRTKVEDTDLYFVDSTSALKSKISDILTAGLSYKVNYVNLVTSGVEHTDRTLSLTLGIDY